MAQFDLTLWKSRAWDRLGRAAKRSKNTKKVKTKLESRWVKDLIAIDDLAKVVEWCEGYRLKVEFVKKSLGTYHSSDRSISISSRASPVKQLVLLLHECGHHLIGDAEQHDRFGMGYPQLDPQVKRTFHHRVSILDEEMEAWARGWKLATRLGLFLKRDVFDSIRLNCIRSYISWALKPSEMEP